MAKRLAIADSEEIASMTTLVTGAKLKTAVESQTFIKDGDPTSAEAVKYDFHLGSRVLKAMYRQPKNLEDIPEENRLVDPGEAVFVLTRERLELPQNMIAVLTPKRRLAHDGIIMLGGLAVDPKYRGYLLIGLYNFSSTPYPLMVGTKLIGAEFYELSGAETKDFDPQSPEEITDFPIELVKLIQAYKPTSLVAVQEALAETQRQLDNLRNDLTSDKQWREDIKASLTKHDQQLDIIIKALDKEQEIRRLEDDKIVGQLQKMSNWFLGIKAGGVVAALLVTAFLGWAVPKALDAVFHPPPPPAVNPPAAAPALPQPQGTATGKQP